MSDNKITYTTTFGNNTSDEEIADTKTTSYNTSDNKIVDTNTTGYNTSAQSTGQNTFDQSTSGKFDQTTFKITYRAEIEQHTGEHACVILSTATSRKDDTLSHGAPPPRSTRLVNASRQACPAYWQRSQHVA